jgi:hypothetical protein
MLSWLERLDQARAELAERDSDPWRRVLEHALPADITAVSTVALCDLLGIRPTTGKLAGLRGACAQWLFRNQSRRPVPVARHVLRC